MLEMVLRDGGIRTRKAGTKAFTNVTWPKERYKLPCNQYSYDPPSLPPIESVYDAMKAEGLNDSAVLRKLIRLYVPWRCFHIGHLEQISKVVGFIGHRGSGKTSSAVYVAVFDWLIRDLPVYSGVDIAVKVRYRDIEKEYHSRPWKGVDMLDIAEDCRGGVVLSDEINLAGGAESTRFMAGANLAWNNDLQQLRKRQLNVLWTAQGWSTVDARTRWQSDYVVECQDCFNDHSYQAKAPGDKAKWHVYELSGLSGEFDLAYELEHRNLMHYEIWSGMIWLRPITWAAYDTYQEQSDDILHQYKLKQATVEDAQQQIIVTARQQPDRDAMQQILASGFDLIWADELWEEMGADKARQTRMGQLMKEHFDRKRDHKSGRYYYIKKGAIDGHRE